MADHDAIDALERQLDKCEAAVTEFHAIDAQLRDQRLTPHVADMITVNRGTIAAIERSMEVMRQRLTAARAAAAGRARSATGCARPAAHGDRDGAAGSAGGRPAGAGRASGRAAATCRWRRPRTVGLRIVRLRIEETRGREDQQGYPKGMARVHYKLQR